MNTEKMTLRAYECLARALNRKPTEEDFRRLLSAAAVAYRELIASSPTVRAATTPEQRWLVENDDATAGWLMISITIESYAYAKRRVVEEFRAWLEAEA